MSRTLPRKDSGFGKKYRERCTIKQEINTEDASEHLHCSVPIKTEETEKSAERPDHFEINHEVLFNERTTDRSPSKVLNIEERCVWDVLREAMKGNGEIEYQNTNSDEDRNCGSNEEVMNLWDRYEEVTLPEVRGLGVKVKVEQEEFEGDRSIERDISAERKEFEEHHDRYVVKDEVSEEDHGEDFKDEEGKGQDAIVKEVTGEEGKSEEVINEEVIDEEVIGEEVIGEEEMCGNSIGEIFSKEEFDDDAHTAWSDDNFEESGEEWVPEESSEDDNSEQEQLEYLWNEYNQKVCSVFECLWKYVFATVFLFFW